MKSQELPRREPLSTAHLRVWLRLLKLTGQVENEIRRRLRDLHNTTLPRFDVMAALARYPDGLKMSELSEHLRVSNGNVTGIVDRLTVDGLACRVDVPGDRRAQIACLTPKGRETFDALAVEHRTWINELLGGLNAVDTEALITLLERAEPEGDDNGNS